MTIWQSLRHPAVLVLTAVLFFCYTGGYAFWFWFPTMLQRLTGWTDVQRIGWVGAIPFIAGLIGMLALGWSSDRTRERRWHFAIPQLTSAIALGAWFFLPHNAVLLVVVFTFVAIKFKCCGGWFSCHHCLAELADHVGSVWPRAEFETAAILCDACGHQLTIREYLACDSVCPRCRRQFNASCAKHHHFYFAI